MCCTLPTSAADIADYFKLYYLQQGAPASCSPGSRQQPFSLEHDGTTISIPL